MSEIVKKSPLLNKFDITMIKLRYEGKSAEEIHEAVKEKYTLSTVETYFGRSGKLYQAYRDYEAQAIEESLSEATTLMKRGVNPAVKKLLQKLKCQDDNVELKAAIELINRHYGKTVDVNANINADLNPIAPFVKEFREELDKAKNADRSETNKD